MSHSITLILCLALVTTCFGQRKNDCLRFQNGKFDYTTHGLKENVTFHLVRKDTLQIETDTRTTYYSKLSIKWTSACSYEALLIESTYPFSDSIQQIRKTVPLKVDILETGSRFYVFKAKRGNSPALTDTVWVKQ